MVYPYFHWIYYLSVLHIRVVYLSKLKVLFALQVDMATLRNLKIKTGTCKRNIKELHSYEKEVEKEAAKTADMKEKGADPYDLKQQVWVVFVCWNNVSS